MPRKDSASHRQYSREYYHRNREAILAKGKLARKKKTQAEKDGAIEYQRWWKIANRYGLSQKQFNTILEEQGNCCKICHKPETKKRNSRIQRLSIDHDHETGKFRGLICDKCNRLLAAARDNPTILRAAARYLKERNNAPRS